MTTFPWAALCSEMNRLGVGQWAVLKHRDAPVLLRGQWQGNSFKLEPSTPPSWCLQVERSTVPIIPPVTYVNVDLDGRLSPLAENAVRTWMVNLLAAETEAALLRQRGR